MLDCLDKKIDTRYHNKYKQGSFLVKPLFAKFPLKTLWLNPIHPNVFEAFYFIDNQVDEKY